MNAALVTLKERGFIQQCTDIDALSKLMDEGPVTFYVGCDPTGPSLHIGHMVPFFALRHLRDAGHHGIALVGGGTARIGDPSGKTEMRKMLSYEQLDANTAAIRAQLDRSPPTPATTTTSWKPRSRPASVCPTPMPRPRNASPNCRLSSAASRPTLPRPSRQPAG